MKQYHTSIIINSSIASVWNELNNFKDYPEWNPLVGKLDGEMNVGSKISTFIIPLKKTFFPTLLSYKENNEIIWKGAQGATFLLSGEHYYRLKEISTHKTELLHGEYFSGLLSYFISTALLKKMKATFVLHNIALKQRLENEKR